MSSIRRVRVGISSWADPALIESRGFYPKKSMSAEARLRFYASVFDVVEVNASYYAIPDVLTVRRWAERTPPGFVFHVKAWALMTGHHPRAQSLPADVARLVSPRARRTHRGEIEAGDFPPEAVDEAAGEAEQVYVSFNNNNRDYPVRNALMLRKMLGQPVAGGQSLPGDLFA